MLLEKSIFVYSCDIAVREFCKQYLGNNRLEFYSSYDCLCSRIHLVPPDIILLDYSLFEFIGPDAWEKAVPVKAFLPKLFIVYPVGDKSLFILSIWDQYRILWQRQNYSVQIPGHLLMQSVVKDIFPLQEMVLYFWMK